MTKKEMILNAAEELFSEKGYEKTTMDDIASRLGIRKGGIYYHFKNKEDIMRYVVIKQIELFKKHIKTRVDDCQLVDEKLHAYIIGRLQFLNDFKESYEYLKIDFVESCQFVSSNIEDLGKWEAEFVRDVFINETNDESLNNTFELLTDIVITFSRGIELSWFLDEDKNNLYERSDKFADMVIAKYKQIIKK